MDNNKMYGENREKEQNKMQGNCQSTGDGKSNCHGEQKHDETCTQKGEHTHGTNNKSEHCSQHGETSQMKK